MSIINFKEKIPEFEKFLTDKIFEIEASDYEDYYYSDGTYDYPYILEHLDELDDLKLITDKNNNIITFLSEKIELGITILDVDDNIDEELLLNALNQIKQAYEHPILTHSYEIYETHLVQDINLDSNFKKDTTYRTTSTLVCLNDEDVDIVRNKIEDTYFPAYSGKLSFEVVSNDVFSKTFQKSMHEDIIIPEWKEGCSNSTYIGFHYLEPSAQEKDKFFFVGVIKYGIYPKYENDNKYYSFNYIDVKEPYRQNGIATQLITEFGKQLQKENVDNLPLKLTQESTLGHKCHMKDKVIQLIEDTEILYDNHSTYEQERFLNGEKIENEQEVDLDL